MKHNNFKRLSLKTALSVLAITFVPASFNAYAGEKPKAPWPPLMGSKTAVKPNNDANAEKAEAALKKAASRLGRNKEFLRLASAHDADGVRQMLVRTANVDAPFPVTFGEGVGGPAEKIKVTFECDGPGFLRHCHLHINS